MNIKNKIPENSVCSCGKIHSSTVDDYIIKKGAIELLPQYIKKYNAKKAFLLADVNTYPVAGDRICTILAENSIECSKYIFPDAHLEPDEKAVGSAIMHYNPECDIIIALGSGVINDIGKIISKTTHTPYIIAATAPSMDGYASATSSVIIDGVKSSLGSKCPDIIIGDTDLLKTAPIHMSKSGLGDILAKYISICEWRISNLITGEYYCEEIASLVRTSVKNCVQNAAGLLEKNDKSIETVFENLILSGLAMEYAGLSRPASGVEHYFSHIWDMRSVEFGTNADLHGIQCAIGTLYSLKIYEQIKKLTPDEKKAVKYAENFNLQDWNKQLYEFVGKGAKSMIALEEKEQKYSPSKHKERFKKNQ